jgi:hypothetical protein
VLGILSSRFHLCWALATGGWLGIGNDPRYSKSRTFDPFPFPAASPAQTATIAALAEELDAARKAVLAEEPGLTLTGLYNVLALVRGGGALTAAQEEVRRRGRVDLIGELHAAIDAAVAAAYGWPAGLDDAAIVARLVALNAERAAEGRGGEALTATAIARRFAQGRRIERRVTATLEALARLGHVAAAADGYRLRRAA